MVSSIQIYVENMVDTSFCFNVNSKFLLSNTTAIHSFIVHLYFDRYTIEQNNMLMQ